MTYQSKAALREEIAELQAKLRRASEDRKLHEVDIKLAKEYSAFTTRRDSLELVLKALKIPGYTSTVYGSKVYTTDRFHADLETALRVRAEKKQEAEDAATEARVAGFAKKPSGDMFSFSFIPTSGEYDATAPTLADLTPQSETVEKIIKKSKGDKK